MKPIKEDLYEQENETPDSKNRILCGKSHNYTGISGLGGAANYDTEAISDAPKKNQAAGAADKSSVLNASGVVSDIMSKKKGGGNQSSSIQASQSSVDGLGAGAAS